MGAPLHCTLSMGCGPFSNVHSTLFHPSIISWQKRLEKNCSEAILFFSCHSSTLHQPGLAFPWAPVTWKTYTPFHSFAHFFIFFFFKHLYWSIIALQWCVSFCFITKWISYTYTICSHISSLLHLPPSHPPHPTPLGGHKAPSWSPCAMRLLPTSYLFYIW